MVAEFHHETSGLDPSPFIAFDDLWNTTAAKEGTYRIMASVVYASTATDPILVTVSTEPDRTYPPLVVRDGH